MVNSAGAPEPRLGISCHSNACMQKEAQNQKYVEFNFNYLFNTLHSQIGDGIPLATRFQYSPQCPVMEFSCGQWFLEIGVMKQTVDRL